MLLAYYISKVFHWQFQFCASRLPSLDQGHILWLMSRSQSLYHGVLMLSSTHKSLQTTSSNLGKTESELTARYNMAMASFQRDLQRPKSCDDVQILGCILMFLNLTFLYGSSKVDWPVHLEAGTSIVSSWIDHNFESTISKTRCKQNSPESIEESIRSILICSIIRFDIFSCLTRDSAPSLIESYRRVFRRADSVICMQSALGCHNWVFSIILDIYALRDWKKLAISAGVLSMWELTSKARTIKRELENNISLNFDRLENIRHLSNEEDDFARLGTREYEDSVVTHIFACAASVLVEVIVSGSNPQLPEIKRAVDRALESYVYISDVELLHVLRWPLFVVGCVAEPEHYDIFRTLLSLSSVTKIPIFRDTLEYLEKNWEMTTGGRFTREGHSFSQDRPYMSCNLLIA
ncbi:fungal-specific transcription factor domain-containing protein [Xylogone sp. PMI_703]|nr:fungal-specific transcription factor domain-containing protein [Xylogone sp. PMI_703]